MFLSGCSQSGEVDLAKESPCTIIYGSELLDIVSGFLDEENSLESGFSTTLGKMEISQVQKLFPSSTMVKIVSARIVGPKINSKTVIGTWSVGNGRIIALDANAKKYSGWGQDIKKEDLSGQLRDLLVEFSEDTNSFSCAFEAASSSLDSGSKSNSKESGDTNGELKLEGNSSKSTEKDTDSAKESEVTGVDTKPKDGSIDKQWERYKDQISEASQVDIEIPKLFARSTGGQIELMGTAAPGTTLVVFVKQGVGTTVWVEQIETITVNERGKFNTVPYLTMESDWALIRVRQDSNGNYSNQVAVQKN